MSAVIKCIWRKKVNDHGSHLPFPNNSVPFGPSSPPPEAPQACKPPLLLLVGRKVAALGSSLSSLKQGWEHVRTLKGYREKEKGKSTVVLSSSVPSPELLPVSLSDMRLVGGGGRSPLPSRSSGDGLFCPSSGEQISQMIRWGHGPGGTMTMCSSPVFKRNVFLVYGSVQLNNFQVLFSAVFLGPLARSLLTQSLFLYIHPQTHFTCMPLLALVVVAEAPLGCMCI